MNHRLLITGFFIAVLLAGIVVTYSRPARIDIVHPHRRAAVEAVYATGTVEPSVMFPVAPRMAGRLMALYADEGQKVKKGQILAQLEDTDLQKTLEELQSKADQTRKDYIRKSSEHKNGAVSTEVLEQALADRDSAAAAVAQAQAQIDYMKLQAPADGVIIQRDGEIGQLIPVNQPVFWMSCCAPLRISAEVDEEDIALVQPGQDVAISADAFPSQIFNGVVQSITPKGDPVARSYRVRIGLTGDTPLMTGMTAETNIIVKKSDNALLVPASALDKGRVWVASYGSLTSVPVKTGVKTAKAVEITEGVKDEDDIVLTPDTALHKGERIRTVLKDWQDK